MGKLHWFWSNIWQELCAPTLVNLLFKTKAEYICNSVLNWVIEETLSYGRLTLANFPKNSQCYTRPITYSPPRTLLYLQLTYFYGHDNYNISVTLILTTLHHEKTLAENSYICSVRIFTIHKQAQLYGIVFVTKNKNLIGNTCFRKHRTNWNTYTQPISVNRSNFPSTWSWHAHLVCVLKFVSHNYPIDSGLLLEKFEGRCCWNKLHSPFNYNKNTSSTLVYDQGANS